MITAQTLLANQNSHGLCLTVGGVEYTDTSQFGSTAEDRITSPLTWTRAIGGAFEPSVLDTLGSVRLAHTELAPLPNAVNQSFRDQPITAEVFGIANHGTGDQEIVYYDQRLPLLSAKSNGASYSQNSFQLSIGSDTQALDTDLLESREINTGSVGADDISFSTLSDTSVQSTGDIGIAVNSSDAPYTIDFTDIIGRLELSIGGGGDGDDATKHTGFNFQQVTPNNLRSEGTITIDIIINDLSTTEREVILRLSEPVSSFKWLMRQIFGNVVNYSHTPVSIDEVITSGVTPEESGTIEGAFPNTDTSTTNSVITWSNLPGVTELSFTVTGVPANGILVPDAQGRAYSQNFKMWLVEATEGVSVANNIQFNIAADDTPEDTQTGTYVWNNLDADSLTITADFDGPVTLEATDNQVILKSDTANVVLNFELVAQSDAGNRARVLRPFIYGNRLNNVTPVSLGSGEFDVGELAFNVREVRENGVVLPRIFNETTLQNNIDNNIKSWIYETNSGGVIRVSGDVNVITCDAITSGGLFFQAMDILGQKVGLTIDVDEFFARQHVSLYYTRQMTLRQMLDDILSSIDAVFILDGDTLTIENRAEFTDVDFDDRIFADEEIIGQLQIGAELAPYRSYEAVYDRNFTQQNNVIAYRGQGQIATNDDETLALDSPTREVITPFRDAAPANRVVQKRVRDSLRRHAVSFNVTGRQFNIKLNSRIQLITPLLRAGMFVPERTIDVTGRTTTQVSGIYYVAA